MKKKPVQYLEDCSWDARETMLNQVRSLAIAIIIRTVKDFQPGRGS